MDHQVTASSRERDWAMWMRAAIDGDAVAYRLLLKGIAPHIRAVARSRCRMMGDGGSEVEDIVQEVLLAIHIKRGTWDAARPIGPWISAITRNKLIDIFRRRGHRKMVPIEDVMETLPAEATPPELSERDVDKLLGHLKTQQRDIVESISLKGSSIRETADRLKMTEGAVRVALHRALKALGDLYRSSLCED